MEKQKIKRFFIIIVFGIFLFFVLSNNNVQALNLKVYESEEIKEVYIISMPAKIQHHEMSFNTNKYKPNNTTEAEESSELGDIGNSIIKVIRNIASGASVMILMVLAIKYMMGSVEEKAQYKKTMFPYVIGCVLVFGITNILSIVMNLVSKAL